MGGSANGKHIMSGSEVGTTGVGGFNSTSIGGKISSQHYIGGGSSGIVGNTTEFRSKNELEVNSYNKMQMSSVSSSSSPRNVLNSNGKKYEMYYETKYE